MASDSGPPGAADPPARLQRGGRHAEQREGGGDEAVAHPGRRAEQAHRRADTAQPRLAPTVVDRATLAPATSRRAIPQQSAVQARQGAARCAPQTGAQRGAKARRGTGARAGIKRAGQRDENTAARGFQAPPIRRGTVQASVVAAGGALAHPVGPVVGAAGWAKGSPMLRRGPPGATIRRRAACACRSAMVRNPSMPLASACSRSTKRRGGQRDDGQAAAASAFAQGARGLVAAHHRHLHVHQHRVRQPAGVLGALDGRDRLAPVAGLLTCAHCFRAWPRRWSC